LDEVLQQHNNHNESDGCDLGLVSLLSLSLMEGILERERERETKNKANLRRKAAFSHRSQLISCIYHNMQQPFIRIPLLNMKLLHY